MKPRNHRALVLPAAAVALALGAASLGCSTRGPAPDRDHDGYDAVEDCHDANSAVSPGASEVCGDGLDNDCDLAVDATDPDCAAP
ncbi:MAG: putative metal-binding motif-containing protein [Myxococcales bacterium]|nr:putative metal-binding motif-containing protein [Myxococcales bacterium]